LRKVLVVLLVLVLAVSLVMVGCSQKQEATQEPKEKEEAKEEVKTIKIGAIYPLTGNIAATGLRNKQAVETAVKIINGKYDIDIPLADTEGLPNLGGAKIEVVFGDHQANPEIGKSEAERLITSEKVIALIGAYNSAVTKPTSQIAERYKIPYVCGASSSAKLTERGLKYFNRIAPTDDTDSKTFFEYLNYLNEKFDAGIKTIALVYENTEYGVHAAEMAKKWRDKAYTDYEIVADIPYTFGATNVNSEVQKVKEANPDAIFHASLIGDVTLFVKTYKELDVNPKAVLNYCGGFQDPKFVENLGKDGEYWAGTNAFAATLIDKMPVLKQVNDLYKEISGVDFDGPSLEVFAAAMVLADAINEAGSTNAEDIIKVLRSKEFKTPYLVAGKVKFGENGQNIYAESVMTQLLNGKYEVVYPETVATSDPVVPIPKWSER